LLLQLLGAASEVKGKYRSGDYQTEASKLLQTHQHVSDPHKIELRWDNCNPQDIDQFSIKLEGEKKKAVLDLEARIRLRRQQKENQKKDGSMVVGCGITLCYPLKAQS
jgi:hypothetical protein